jgi:hypothetical protein
LFTSDAKAGLVAFVGDDWQYRCQAGYDRQTGASRDRETSMYTKRALRDIGLDGNELLPSARRWTVMGSSLSRAFTLPQNAARWRMNSTG